MNRLNTKNKTFNQRSAWDDLKLPTVIGVLLGLLILIFFYSQWTLVSGTEFNPKTWDLRVFSFRRDPFTKVQLTGVSYSASPTAISAWNRGNADDLQSTLVSELRALLAQQPVTENRWDLVAYDPPNSSKGEAYILVDLLEARSSGVDSYWVEWSKSNPARAKKLWPAVQSLAMLSLYEHIPDIILCTVTLENAVEFETEIVARTHRAILESCEQLLESGDKATAILHAETGLKLGDHPGLSTIVGGETSSE